MPLACYLYLEWLMGGVCTMKCMTNMHLSSLTNTPPRPVVQPQAPNLAPTGFPWSWDCANFSWLMHRLHPVTCRLMPRRTWAVLGTHLSTTAGCAPLTDSFTACRPALSPLDSDSASQTVSVASFSAITSFVYCRPVLK